MAFFALGKKMRQVYSESQKQKFVQAYEEFFLMFRVYCKLINISPYLFYPAWR
jgi:ABC-type transporter MlaC component